MRQYHVYLLASTSRRLYLGITSNLIGRSWNHRNGTYAGFTARSRIDKLVHFEGYADACTAIAREKEIKCWRRERKEWLVTATNAGWLDLSADRLGAMPVNAISPSCPKTDGARS